MGFLDRKSKAKKTKDKVGEDAKAGGSSLLSPHTKTAEQVSSSNQRLAIRPTPSEVSTALSNTASEPKDGQDDLSDSILDENGKWLEVD